MNILYGSTYFNVVDLIGQLIFQALILDLPIISSRSNLMLTSLFINLLVFYWILGIKKFSSKISCPILKNSYPFCW